MVGTDNKTIEETNTKDEEKFEEPKMYKVVLHNDDYTPMDFVSKILCQVFHMQEAAADSVTLAVHEKGKGIAGVFTKEIAEMKVATTKFLSKKFEHPLETTMEQE